MSSWFENHQPHRTQIFKVANVRFVSKSLTLVSFKTRFKWPPVLTKTASFPSLFFQLLIYSRQHPSFSAPMTALMTKTDLIFLAFSLRFVDFAVLFCFRCKFSFLKKPFELSLTLAWFFWTNHNSLLRIATNEIASFCLDKDNVKSL